MGRKKLPTPPNTDIPFKEYEKLATDLYFNKGKKPAQIKAQLGNPHWDGKDWFIEFRKTSPNKLIRTEAHKKTNQLTKRKKRSQFVDNEVEKWAKRLDKQGKWPKGKSLDGFIASEKRLQTLYDKEIDRLKSLGLNVSDGHIIALANENVRGTPLDAKGKGGSHSPRSRVPEMLAENKSRGAKYDIPKLTARRAGIPTTSSEAFLQYLTGDTGTGVHLGTKDKQRIHIKGENPDKVIAERYNYVEGKKIEAANKVRALTESVRNKTNQLSGVQAFAKQQLMAQTQNYDANFTPKNGNGNGSTNGTVKVPTNGPKNGFKNGGKNNFLSSMKNTKNLSGLKGVITNGPINTDNGKPYVDMGLNMEQLAPLDRVHIVPGGRVAPINYI